MRMLREIRETLQPMPGPLSSAISGLRDRKAQPSPWDAWVLIALMRHLPRQRWVRTVAEELGARPEELARFGSGAHPPGKGFGPVPGHPGWTYRFHGRGCCVESESGEEIDVDFRDATADVFDPWFFRSYLESLSRPAFPEERLLALHADRDSLELSLRALHRADLIQFFSEDSSSFRLSPEVAALADTVAAEPFEGRARMVWWAASLGDWPLVEQLAPELDVRAQAQATRAARTSRLLELVDDPLEGAAALRALTEVMSRSDLEPVLGRVLEGPVDRRTSAALEVLLARGITSSLPAVRALFTRLVPQSDGGLALLAARVLLETGVPFAEVWSRARPFAEAERVAPSSGNPFLADWAELALARAPKVGEELLQRALRSSVPLVQMRARELAERQ
jgi:hypothetical protein